MQLKERNCQPSTLGGNEKSRDLITSEMEKWENNRPARNIRKWDNCADREEVSQSLDNLHLTVLISFHRRWLFLSQWATHRASGTPQGTVFCKQFRENRSEKTNLLKKISPEPKQSYKRFAQWRSFIMIDVSRHWSFYSKEISGNLKRKLMKKRTEKIQIKNKKERDYVIVLNVLLIIKSNFL